MLRVFTALIFFILAATNGRAQTPRDLTGIVTAVPSGDEIEIGGIHIRLQGIAAPGRYMPFGGDAAAFMQLLVLEKEVTCRLTGERTRGREVGLCEWNGVDIAGVIVREGLARDCPRFSRGRYANDEREAKDTGLLGAYPLPDYCGSGV
jgi:micrococcal nuclease